MNKPDRFALCFELARRIVAAHRREAPEGCDPQNSGIAVGLGIASLAGGIYASNKQSKDAKAAQKSAIEQNTELTQQQKKDLGDLIDRLDLGHVPDAAMYKPVNFNKQQLASVLGNQKALPDIQQLIRSSSEGTREEDIRRAVGLIPGYRQMMKKEGSAASSLLGGQLPYDDVLGIVSDRAGLAGSLGIPGTAGAATLKDLGMSRLDAITKGGGLFKDMVNIAQTVSPIERYAKPTDFFLTPQQRISGALEQHQLLQQSQQNANNLEATADPTTVGRQQLELLKILGTGAPLSASPIAAPNYAAYGAQALGSLSQYFGQSRGTGLSPGSNYGGSYGGSFGTNPVPGVTNQIYRPGSYSLPS